jgi:hypothetical protein
MPTAIDDRLDVNSLVVDTDLPDLLATTDTAIGSTGAVIAAILLQLVGVALYGVGLSASVLASSRAVETSMLRARGATPAQLGTMAAVEAVLVAAPAVAIGPWAGSRVVELVERWGPVAQTELDLQPASARRMAVGGRDRRVRRRHRHVAGGPLRPRLRPQPGGARPSRRRAPAAADRTRRRDRGVAIIGLWRLSASSAATSDLSGRLGTDPVLVLAPTLGVVAGSLLTLRLISVVAGAVQRVTARRGALPMALAGWEIARRPGRTARTSVLIVLSVTVGTFAAVHGASWQQSLRDQADAAVSVDVLVTPDPRPAASLPQQYVADAYIQLDGVDEVFPVDRPTASLSAELSSVPVVLADASALGEGLRLRPDLYGDAGSPEGYAALHRPTDLGGVELGDATGDLVVDYELAATPASASGSIVLTATVLDRHGTPVHLDGERIAVSDTAGQTVTGAVTFPLRTESVPGLSLGLAGPLQLVSLDVAFPSVRDVLFTDDPLPPAVYRLSLGPGRVGDRPISLAGGWSVGGGRPRRRPRRSEQRARRTSTGSCASPSTADRPLAPAPPTPSRSTRVSWVTEWVRTSPCSSRPACSTRRRSASVIDSSPG